MGRMKDQLGEAPPTVGAARAFGVVTLLVQCGQPCRREARIALDTLRLPDDTPFPEIANRKRFLCAECGRRAWTISVDWRNVKEPPGAG